MNAGKIGLIILISASARTSCAVESLSSGGGYVLKNQSSYSGTADARSPFWPIDWRKSAPAPVVSGAAAASTAIDLRPENFSVSSILLGTAGGQGLAVINGKGYAEGEFLKLPPGQSGKVQVAEIHDGAVVLVSAGRKVTVPLRRR